MNEALIIGTRLVVFALLFYSIGIFTEQHQKLATNVVLTFITLGIITDITATAYMIIGSENSAFTLHGLLGYSSLLAMLIDATLLWHHRFSKGVDAHVTNSLHKYSRYAYIWWLLAFITGAVLVFIK